MDSPNATDRPARGRGLLGSVFADPSDPADRPLKRRGLSETLFSVLGQDMAVDLGTANTLVYVRGEGIVLEEPSVVAVNTHTDVVLAVGNAAKLMIGRTPSHIQAIRPLKDGVIADFDVTEKMLRYFIQQVHRRSLLAKPRIVICVPSGITGVEQRAVEEAAIAAGARRAYIIEEPMAAAIGADLPINEATGSMIVDIGGGTSEVAIISLGGMVRSSSLRIGGDKMDAAIVDYARKEYSLALGARTAEKVKIAIGSAFPTKDGMAAQVVGRDLASGLPKTIEISDAELREALEEPVSAIIDTIRQTLDDCPAELAGDIMRNGICLTGGGAKLRGLDSRLTHETGVNCYVAKDPLWSVALGSGRCLEEFDVLQRVLVTSSPRR
ncbi:MAG: rod shape-determining protein [Actinomycetota bacterium]